MDGGAMRIQLLQQQKDRLAQQLEEKRRDIAKLEEKVAGLEEKQEEYATTMLCVARQWDQLDVDIQALITRVAPEPGPTSSNPTKTERGEEKLDAITTFDPYLGALLAGADAAAVASVYSVAEDIDSELCDVERRLCERRAGTQRALSRLLDMMRTQPTQAPAQPVEPVQPQQDAEMQTAEGHPPVQGPVLVSQAVLDAQAAHLRALSQQVRLANDRLLEAGERIKALEAESSDYQQALSASQRKLSALQQKQQQQAAAQAGHAQPDGGTHGPAGGAPAPAPGAAGTPGDAAQGAGAPARAASGALGAAQPAGAGGQAGAPAGGEPDDGTAEEVGALLDKRVAELDAERAAHALTQRALDEARVQVTDESGWVRSTATYRALADELAAVNEALAARGRELEALVHDKEAAEARVLDRTLLAQRESQALARVSELGTRLASLTAAKAETDARLAECEAACAVMRHRLETSQAAPELQRVVSTLQTRLAVKEQQLRQAQVPADRVAASAQEVVAARTAVGEAQALKQQADARVQGAVQAVHESKQREDRLHERLADLQVFVDVLSVAAPPAPDLAAQLAAARGEASGLQARVAHLEAALAAAASSPHPAAAAALEASATARLAETEQALAAAQGALAGARAQVEALDAQLAGAREDCAMYTQEIESSNSCYDELVGQNARLLGLLADKEEALGVLTGEKAKLQAAVARLEEVVEHMRRDTEHLRQQVFDTQKAQEQHALTLQQAAADLQQAREQARLGQMRAASLEAEAQRRQAAHDALATQLEGAQRSLAEAREHAAQESERVAKERVKRQRVEEEIKSLQSRLGRLRKANSLGGGAGAGGAGSGPGASAAELAHEVEAMRKLLNCNVCHERQKNVIITKCCHVFCDKCIKRNLEARNRKCPGCGAAFGQADVRNFFFT